MMTRKKGVRLFSKNRAALPALVRKVRNASGVFLFLDYDGTLTPIRKRPSEARLPLPAKALLARLSALPDITIAIVTGRSMKSIRRFVPLDGIIFASNHGLHIRYNDETEWIHPSALGTIGVMVKLRRKLRAALKDFSGVIVEDKELTLSIHFRNCAPALVPRVKKIVTDIVSENDPELRITKGKKVLEVRPPAVWGKGRAVMELLHASGQAASLLAVYVGDDVTDEEAFEKLKRSGITVHVGGSGRTSAHYAVNDAEEVLELLQLIYLLRQQDAHAA